MGSRSTPLPRIPVRREDKIFKKIPFRKTGERPYQTDTGDK